MTLTPEEKLRLRQEHLNNGSCGATDFHPDCNVCEEVEAIANATKPTAESFNKEIAISRMRDIKCMVDSFWDELTRENAFVRAKAKYCEFCGHALRRERVHPPTTKFDIAPEGEGGSDGKMWLCINDCFCSYGGCNPERQD